MRALQARLRIFGITVCLALTGAVGDAHARAAAGAVQVTAVETIAVPAARQTQMFRFNDGRIVLDGGAVGLWSSDQGHSWTPGPRGPATGGEKAAIDLGSGEILSLNRTPFRAGGKLGLPQSRSLDNWRTVRAETAPLSAPGAMDVIGDDCRPDPGPLFHHGLVRLKGGVLAASGYGRTAADQEDADAYPATCGFKKLRAMVMFSKDKGHSWGDPVAVAWGGMANPRTGARYVAREGFDESDLAATVKGDLVIVMRTGGVGGSHPGPATPLYLARSTDGGRHWSAPVAIANAGADPNLAVLGNGVIALTYGGGGGWVVFSADDGRTWGRPVQLTRSDSYTDLVSLGGDGCLVAYYNADLNAFAVTRFVVRRGR